MSLLRNGSMNHKADRDDSVPSIIQKYRESIPRDLRGILMPDSTRDEAFAGAVKRLKLYEIEREYVRELQEYYNVPLRPNESVKRTMIRVRLRIIKKVKAGNGQGRIIELSHGLPVDPLE